MIDALIQIVAGVIGTLGFAIILNIRGTRLVFTVLGGFASGIWKREERRDEFCKKNGVK